jgi:DNA-binding transcriptional ArsR family regulator
VSSKVTECSKANPCPHCGKTGWCYLLDNGWSACNRKSPPASGWKQIDRADTNGIPYYAPIDQGQTKAPRPAQIRYWEYPDRDGNPSVRVKREDFGDGRKDIKQQHWDGKEWKFGLGGKNRDDIPIYRYAEVRWAIAEGEPIFIAEGEPAADALWSIGLAATTNLGGTGQKWRLSNTADLTGATAIVLCPDRDEPGIKHMEFIAQAFPDAHWLYVYPIDEFWSRLPSSGGIDVADWISEQRLDKDAVMLAIGSKREAWHRSAKTQQLSGKQHSLTVSTLAERMAEIDKLPHLAERSLALLLFAKEVGLPKRELTKVYAQLKSHETVAARISQQEDIYDVEREPDPKYFWIIPGLLPCQALVLLYAKWGMGKTLFAHDLMYSVGTGQPWGGIPVKQGKILYLQSDNPKPTIRRDWKLRSCGTMPRGVMMVQWNWRMVELDLLRATCETFNPELIVIDSLTATNAGSVASENEKAYVDGLFDLKVIQDEFKFSAIVIHHANKEGEVRGSTAIPGAFDEIWKLFEPVDRSPEYRVLEIVKSRAKQRGQWEFQFDEENLGWEHKGPYEPGAVAPELLSRPGDSSRKGVGARILEFLAERPGVGFLAEELHREHGGSLPAVRRELSRLVNGGLIESKESSVIAFVNNGGRYGKKLYYVPDLGRSSVEALPNHGFTDDRLSHGGVSRSSVEALPNQGFTDDRGNPGEGELFDSSRYSADERQWGNPYNEPR